MEARRTFESGAKGSRVWIVVGSLLAAAALGLAGGYVAKGTTTVAAPSTRGHAVIAIQAPAPGSQLYINGSQMPARANNSHGGPGGSGPGGAAQQGSGSGNAAPAVVKRAHLTVF